MLVTPEEQLKKIDEKMKQLKAQKQTLRNKEKQKQEKERTRLLIRYGEIVEKLLPLVKTPEQLEEYLNRFSHLYNLKSDK